MKNQMKEALKVSIEILLFSFCFIGILVFESMWRDLKFSLVLCAVPMASSFMLGRITGEKKVYLSDAMFLVAGVFCLIVAIAVIRYSFL